MKRKTDSEVTEQTVETVTLTSSESEPSDTSDIEEIIDNESIEQVIPTQVLTDEDVVHVPNADDRVVLVLADEKSIYFKGKLSVEVLTGEIQVLGASIKACDGMRDIYSPRGYSLLCLTSKRDKVTSSLEPNLDEILIQLGLKTFELRTRLSTAAKIGSTLVLLSKIGGDSSDFVSRYLSHSTGGKVALFGRDLALLPRTVPDLASNLVEAERKLDVNFFFRLQNQDLKARLYQPNPDWENAILSARYTIDNSVQPRLLVAGGKGVGKSTLVRFLVNRLISEVKGPVLVVDLDPGQAEFTVPGCVSCTVIDSPMLGPNFTHVSVKKEICLFLGTVDVASSQSRFLKCMTKLAEKCSQFSSFPWIINTMGFSEGLGIHLMKKAVETFRPTTIIEIESRSYKKNFKPREFFSNLVSTNHLSCNVLRFMAMPESLDARNFGIQDAWGIPQASKLRDIVMLSFIEASFPKCRSLQGIPPRAVAWSEIYVQLLNVRESFSTANLVKILNTGFVSLGHHSDGPELKSDSLNVMNSEVLIPSLGFGIIRSIDVERKIFYVITDLNEKTLQSVNCMTIGPTVRLPNGILANQNAQKSAYLPYISKSNSKCLLSTPWQRHSKPRPAN